MDTIHDSLIMIVDDSEQNIRMLKSILEKNNYRVTVARNGFEALEQVKIELPSLILLDIVMPDMDGIETCRRLKAHDDMKDIPVVFITALSETSEKMRAFDAGGVDYIDRPFVKEEVLARINVHVKLRETMETLKKLSVTDELTGAFNRRFAYQMLERQIRVARRERENFILCYCDIDNLKSVNDTCGHEAGDTLIKTMVNSLLGIIRKSDFLFRMGGDEFLILFPGAKCSESANLIERIRDSLNKHKIDDYQIDFSFGFVEYSFESNMTPHDLIKAADARMYKEKMKKKNKA
ncbi:MAG TPA: diguanylate cyclase [Spirochaetota bacterium]|nr:diguanylate cyclase [Spirochaetota bacterium]HPI88521.1 diguanylate cyclase [Spirochaetota bacterium]HPR48001.1 diguanylate cyclase [Spirochaetota bacterium]